MKGHASDITDLRFADSGANRFVSGDVGGTFVIWDLKETGRVKNESTGTEEAQLEFAKTLVVDVPVGVGVSVVRAAWNPTNPGILATAYSDNFVVLWSVALLKQSASPVVDSTGGHFTLRRPATAELPSFANSLPGVLAVINVGSPVHDLSFSADGSSLAVGSLDGSVRVYSNRGTLAHEWQPHGGAAVYASLFLTGQQSAGLILTGGPANDQLCLWDAKTYKLLQTLTFEPSSNEPASSVKLGQRVAFDRSGNFCAVAHNNQPYLHVFHLHVPSDPSQTPFFDYMTEFGLGAADDKGAPSPVLSFVVTNHKPHSVQVNDDTHLQLFCAQTKYIQMYRLHAAQCYPGPQNEGSSPASPAASATSSASSSSSVTPPPQPLAVESHPSANPSVPAAEPTAPSTPAIDLSRLEQPSEPQQASADPAAPADAASGNTKPKKDKNQKKQKETPLASPANNKHKAKGKAEQPESVPAAPVPADVANATPQSAAGRVAKNNKRGRTKSQLDGDTSRDNDLSSPASAVITLPSVAIAPIPDTPIPLPEPVSTEGLDANAALMLQRLETMMKQQNDYFVAQLERQRREYEHSAEERQRALLAAFATSLNTSLEHLIQKQIKANFQSLGKIMAQSMESMLTANLAEALKKAVKEGLKETQGSHAEDIASRITEPVGHAFRTHFASVLAPSFERALQAMFTQISATLEQGIQQYTAQLGAAGPSGAYNGNGVGQLGSAVSTLVDISERMNRSLVDTQSKLVSTLLDVVGRARSTSGPRGAPAPTIKPVSPNTASPSSTPAPTATTGSSTTPAAPAVVAPRPKSSSINTPPFPEAVASALTAATSAPAAPVAASRSLEEVAVELQRLINESKFVEAITVCLSARNLDAVHSVCTALDSKKEDIIPKLPQRVLISLIQQLGADLDTATVLKLEWIHIAVPLAEVADTTIATHSGKVLGKLLVTLEALLPIYEKANVGLFNLIRGTLIHTKAQLRMVPAQ